MNSTKPYPLQERTLEFASDVRAFLRRLPPHELRKQDIQQLLRSSGSVGANYIEADEALGTKDFVFRLKICRKEAKESAFWLRLLDMSSQTALQETRESLHTEAIELVRIFSAILKKFT